MKVQVTGNLFPFLPLCKRELTNLLQKLTNFLHLTGSVELHCVDDEEIAVLNKEFLGCNSPTNILSFPAKNEGETGGELVLSRAAVLRESVLYGQVPYEQLIRLLAHGLLHLKGLEHGEEMFRLTEDAVEHCQKKQNIFNCE